MILNRFRTLSIKMIDSSQKISVVSLFVYLWTSFFKLVPNMENLELITITIDHKQQSYIKFGFLLKKFSGVIFHKGLTKALGKTQALSLGTFERWTSNLRNGRLRK